MLNEEQNNTAGNTAAPSAANNQPDTPTPSIEERLKDPKFVIRLKRLGLWYLRDSPKELEEEVRRMDAKLHRRSGKSARLNP